MSHDLINSIWLAASFLGLFGFAEVLYHYLHIKAELTRKLVHFGTGILTFLFPVFLSSHIWVLALCASFALILIVSLKFKLLPSINAVDRITWGSLCYPLAVYVCFVMYEFNDKQSILFYLPILILAICDPLAALVGKRWPWGKYSIFGNHKSLAGSLVFFILASILSYIYIRNYASLNMGVLFPTLTIALVAAIAEAISNKGFDNITIPIAVVISTLFFL